MLTNIFRRVYRMFAHAWFQHRDVFWTIENTEGLYVFYKTVCDIYQLIPEENYTVPPEAEGLAENIERTRGEGGSGVPEIYGAVQAQKRSATVEKVPLIPATNGDTIATTTLSTGATTRRHKATPSTGSFVTSIAEADENEENGAPRTTVSQIPEPPLDVAPMLKNASISDKVTEDPLSPKKDSGAGQRIEESSATLNIALPSVSVSTSVEEGQRQAAEEEEVKAPSAGEADVEATDIVANGEKEASEEPEKVKDEAPALTSPS